MALRQTCDETLIMCLRLIPLVHECVPGAIEGCCLYYNTTSQGSGNSTWRSGSLRWGRDGASHGRCLRRARANLTETPRSSPLR